MKPILSTILLLFPAALANAEIFVVGGKALEIPSPKGFSQVTQEMDAVYRMSKQIADPVNDQLAYYIAESDVPVAIAGEIPSLERYYVLKVNKQLLDPVVGSKDFAELKSLTKRQNREILKSAETQLPGLMEETSKAISEEFEGEDLVEFEEEEAIEEGELPSVSLAELYIKQDLFDEAMNIYHQILDDDPSNKSIRQLLEETAALQGYVESLE